MAPSLVWVVALCLSWQATCQDALVLLGPTGGNALRYGGVWHGIFEAWAGGQFDAEGGAKGTDIFVAMNTPHTPQELRDKVEAVLVPIYEQLGSSTGWRCRRQDLDCSPESLMRGLTMNIWDGRDADAQAENMTQSLQPYNRIHVYLSIPPSTIVSWTDAVVSHWAEGAQQRVHLVAEYPFGTNQTSADDLYSRMIASGLPDANLHIVNYWLSFMLVARFSEFRRIATRALGISWNRTDISRIQIAEFEAGAPADAGWFSWFDGVGQVRDMLQNRGLHLLGVALADDGKASQQERLGLLNSSQLQSCTLGQFQDFLLGGQETYHASFADTTFAELHVSVRDDKWQNVPVSVASGKKADKDLYSIHVYQRNGPGVLTFEVGKEETGLGGIRVKDWPILDTTEFEAPAPGFRNVSTILAKPNVSTDGDGDILNYSDPQLYFPKPYASMISSLVTREYSSAFLSFAEVRRSWALVSEPNESVCLDPHPGDVHVYDEPKSCGQDPPAFCWQPTTVRYLYDVTFNCTPSHDITYGDVSFYQAKCHPAQTLVTLV